MTSSEGLAPDTTSDGSRERERERERMLHPHKGLWCIQVNEIIYFLNWNCILPSKGESLKGVSCLAGGGVTASLEADDFDFFVGNE